MIDGFELGFRNQGKCSPAQLSPCLSRLLMYINSIISAVIIEQYTMLDSVRTQAKLLSSLLLSSSSSSVTTKTGSLGDLGIWETHLEHCCLYQSRMMTLHQLLPMDVYYHQFLSSINLNHHLANKWHSLHHHECFTLASYWYKYILAQ